jgi:transcriptional regulator with XRE-family HTH domain
MTLGENIRSIRKSKFMSIQHVRNLTGLSKSTISELERDISNPTIDTLLKIASAFNLTVDELIKTTPATATAIARWDEVTDNK